MSEKVVTLRGRQTELPVEKQEGTFRSGDHAVQLVAVRGHEAEVRIGGRTHFVPFVTEGTQVSFVFNGEAYTADVTDKGARTKARHRDHSMAAPMPGVVLKILVQPGDHVTKGMPLLVLEAMKMEHQVVAPRDGIVAAVNCSDGELVQVGVDLIELVAPDAGT